MVRNKIYKFRKKYFLLESGDVYRISSDPTKPHAWMNLSVGYVMQNGVYIGNNLSTNKRPHSITNPLGRVNNSGLSE